MRILIATANPTVTGGAETYLQVIIPHLQLRGHDVAFLTNLPPDASRPSVAPRDMKSWSAASRPFASVVLDVAAWKPDVVYGHGSAMDGSLARDFSMAFFAHNYGGTCVSGTKCHAFPNLAPCHRPLGVGCLALYLPRRCGGMNPITALRAFRRARRRQALFPHYRAVLTASKHMAAELIRNGVAPSRVHRIPLFPTGPLPDCEPPAARPLSGRILFVGRITALKGWQNLLDALPRAGERLGSKIRLVVAGDGPDRPAFEAAVRRAGIPADFLGWVHPDRTSAEMRAADLLVVPSVWPEPFGLVGIEAGCVGTPAVGYAVGGIPDWLIPGVSGESAPGERPDPHELAAAIVRAVADLDHWQKLRVGAWENARRFSVDAHLDRLIPILEAAAR